MNEFKTTLVLAVLAVVLVAGVVAPAVTSPWALVGLAPVLLAIAAILRAVSGRRNDDSRKKEESTKTKTIKQSRKGRIESNLPRGPRSTRRH